MKKIILGVILSFAMTTAALCQITDTTTVSNTEIARIINANREFNKNVAGVDDPNKIYVGQVLTYVFGDGTSLTVTVNSGDNQWTIVKKVLAVEKVHGPVVPNDQVGKTPTEDENVAPMKDLTPSSNGVPWWLWAIAVAVIFVLSFLAFKAEKEKAKVKNEKLTSDPVTSGTPMKRGGVSETDAPAYAREVAARQFNIPNLQVTNIVKGTMTGENVAVYYRGEATPQRKTFKDVAAYRGEVMVNGQPQFVYFLQGCGNDVRIGNYFAGENVTFVADPVQSETLRTANVATAGQIQTDEKSESTSDFDLVELAKALTQPLSDKKNGKVSITLPGGAKVEMEFSETMLVNNNHVQIQPANEHAASS